MKITRIEGGTIRSRLLLIVLAALFPVMLLGLWQSQTSYGHARRLVADGLRAHATAIAESERDPFILARQALSFAAQQPAVRQYTPDCTEVLRTALQGAEGIVNFLRTDAQGRARCSVLPFTPGMDMSRDRWWLEAQGKQGLVVSSPQIGNISKQPVLIIARALQTDDGKFNGTLSAGIGLERLLLSMRRKQTGQNGVIIVADGRSNPILQAPAGTFVRLPDVKAAQDDPVEARAADGSNWTFVSASLFGDQLFVGYAEPSQSVVARQISSTRFSILWAVLTLASTSLAIWLGAQRLILRWLGKLQRLAARFARGDFASERSDYADAPAEIVQLSDKLHDMAAAIDHHQKELRDALVVETALTREVHHRVNNNLQIVTSLLSLQSQRTSDPAARDIIGLARTRIGALGLIHRLLYWDRSDGEQGALHLQLLFNELCGLLRAANRDRSHIALECDAVTDMTMSIDQAVPLTLFIVEAVTNAFRHAFTDRFTGQVHVSMENAEGEATLIVRDNGHGFHNPDAQPGMGFDLMRAFAAQLSGTVAIENTDAGATVTLRFPLQAAG